MQPENGEDEIEDLPDDFYDLSVEEVRKLYNTLHQQRLALEDNPLLTANKREEIEKQVPTQGYFPLLNSSRN